MITEMEQENLPEKKKQIDVDKVDESLTLIGVIVKAIVSFINLFKRK